MFRVYIRNIFSSRFFYSFNQPAIDYDRYIYAIYDNETESNRKNNRMLLRATYTVVIIQLLNLKREDLFVNCMLSGCWFWLDHLSEDI